MRGPMCSTRCGPGWIDDGTLCLNKTYKWGPKGIRQKKKPQKKKPFEDKRRIAELEQLLQEGTEKLQAAGFGNPTRYGKFDKRFWEGPYVWGLEGSDKKDTILILKSNVRPSDAYKAMFNEPYRWTFDCTTFVQAVLLYCLFQKHGAEKFDAKLKSDSKKMEGNVSFRSHRSTGLVIKSDDVFSPVTRKTYRPGKDSLSDIALKFAPTGSHIVFTNPDARENADFRNESAIKIEPDLFIAHGIIKGSAFVNRKAIEKKLIAKAIEEIKNLKNVKQIVSVTWVVEYDFN